MADKKTGAKSKEQAPADENIKQRLDMFDQRLDNIDSMVSAVIERVMNQPLSVGVTCPHCGKNIEFALIGNRRPRV